MPGFLFLSLSTHISEGISLFVWSLNTFWQENYPSSLNHSERLGCKQLEHIVWWESMGEWERGRQEVTAVAGRSSAQWADCAAEKHAVQVVKPVAASISRLFSVMNVHLLSAQWIFWTDWALEDFKYSDMFRTLFYNHRDVEEALLGNVYLSLSSAWLTVMVSVLVQACKAPPHVFHT